VITQDEETTSELANVLVHDLVCDSVPHHHDKEKLIGAIDLCLEQAYQAKHSSGLKLVKP